MTREASSKDNMDAQLEQERDRLFSDPSLEDLRTIVRHEINTISRNIYIISYTPEQLEHVYVLLLDGTTVLIVDVPRKGVAAESRVVSCSLEKYKSSGLTKAVRRKLDRAVRLALGRSRSS